MSQKKRIFALYTGAALLQPVKELAQVLVPDFEFINVLDDSLIQDVIQADGVTLEVQERILQYCLIAEKMGVDVIWETCSSVGDTVPLIQPFIKTPIIRIDRAMIEAAVEKYSSIGVLATLETTLQPTQRLIQQVAGDLKKKVHITEGLAQGAFEALQAGDFVKHDAVIREKAKAIAGTSEAIVLAQGSMARMEQELKDITGIPVYSSVESGMKAIKEFFQHTESSITGKGV